MARCRTGAPDLNRIARQQHFLRTAAAAVLAEVNSNPFRLGDLIDAAGGAVRLDAQRRIWSRPARR